MHQKNSVNLSLTDKIKRVREVTNASIAEVKKAIEQCNGDEAAAAEVLKKKGMMIADKKKERTTKVGIVEVYMHSNKKLAAVVEVRCETDFVAKSEDFQRFAHDVAMQIAALKPSYIKASDVPTEIVDDLRAIYRKEFENIKKPPEIIEQIVEGKIQKRMEEICLLPQPFVKNNDMTIEDLMKETIAKFGENIEIGRFCMIEA
ncbi:MAG: elongation factor Ts [Patescibacteria group bacterium]|jgi:elongation factor Ts